MNKTAIFQVGVDILGFPIYVEHHFYTGKNQPNLIKNGKPFWFKVIQKIIKQH